MVGGILRSRIIGGLIGAAAVVALTTLSAIPAQASAAQCNTSGWACAWVDQYTGAFGHWTSSQSSLPGFHDAITAQQNNRTAYIGWFSDQGYSGSLFQVPGGGGGYFTWPDPRNDSFDSLYFY